MDEEIANNEPVITVEITLVGDIHYAPTVIIEESTATIISDWDNKEELGRRFHKDAPEDFINDIFSGLSQAAAETLGFVSARIINSRKPR